MIDVSENSYQIDTVLTALPQKFPFLFVDKVVDLISGVLVRTQKAITYNEWFFQGHFPGNPILPGNIIIEIMAQTAGLLLLDTNNTEVTKQALKPGFLVQCNVKFFKQVKPGVLLDIEAKTKILSQISLVANVIVKISSEKVANGDIIIAFAE